jgi:DNA-binding PadR family transcriptional regulator
MGGFPPLDGLVLTALAERGPATGRGVARAVDRRAPVYPVLRRLERDRLVASRPLHGSTRRQRLYRVTDEGEEALGVWRLAVRRSVSE